MNSRRTACTARVAYRGTFEFAGRLRQIAIAIPCRLRTRRNVRDTDLSARQSLNDEASASASASGARWVGERAIPPAAIWLRAIRDAR